MSSECDKELLEDFLSEAGEALDSLDTDLVALESQPEDEGILRGIFRCVHSIKGNAGMLELKRLESVAHSGEALLTEVLNGRLRITPDVTTLLLRVVDTIRVILGQLEADASEGDDDHAELLAQLEAAKRSTDREASPDSAAKPRNQIGEILVRKGVLSREDVDWAFTLQNQGDPRRIGEILVEGGKCESSDIVEALHEMEHQRSMAHKPRTIRMDVDVLDRLLNLAEELLPACSQLLEAESALQSSAHRVTRLMQELKESVARTRMQRVGVLWDRFPRMVRDLALSCQKKVQVQLEGGDIEMDKAILEALRDPMTHIVRNAIDHGIETPEERIAKGKSEEGCLTLRAEREANLIILEISDDGAGIVPERVRAKALEQELVSPEEAAAMDDCEVISLIFTPGFSTADHVSNISGRGVGMDVVRFNIEEAGGEIDVVSTPGLGSTLRISFPA